MRQKKRFRKRKQKLHKKKAQIRLFESIAVLVIFVFIIALGLKFYTNVKIAKLKDAEARFSELDAVKSAIILSNLPEISCSFQGISETACFDLYKVIAWNNKMNGGPSEIAFIDYYLPVLGRSEMVIERIYPKISTEQNEWTIYNGSVGIDKRTGFDYVRQPVVLHDTITRTNQLGVLHIKTYTQS
mgnify:CR=1 FL=1